MGTLIVISLILTPIMFTCLVIELFLSKTSYGSKAHRIFDTLSISLATLAIVYGLFVTILVLIDFIRWI